MSSFVKPHVFFNDLNQFKPIRCSFNRNRIRNAFRLSPENIDDIGNNLNMFLTRKSARKTLMIFLVVDHYDISDELTIKYSNCLHKIQDCEEKDDNGGNDWTQIKSIQFVQYDEFFSLYGKCDALFEGESLVKRTGTIDYPSEILHKFLFLGNFYNASDNKVLQSLGITHIVDASGEYSSRDCAAANNVRYLPMRIWDCGTTDIAVHFQTVNAFIDDCRAHPNGRILIHCRAGISRSATFVLAYLLHSHHKSSAVCDGTAKKTEEADGVSASDLREALSVVLDQRPYICPNEGFRAQLMQHESRLLGSASVADDEEMLSFISTKNIMWANNFSAETDFDRIPIGEAGRRPIKVGMFTSEYPEEGSESLITDKEKPKKPFLKRGQGVTQRVSAAAIKKQEIKKASAEHAIPDGV